jgi:putative heme-binding domain-containing protein
VKYSIIASLIALACACPAAAQQVQGDEPNRGGEVDMEAVDPEIARSRLFPAEGFEVELFASEKDFPIQNPVALSFDARGRLWVATMPTYPQRLPDEEPQDKLIILEDTDRDGRADKHTVFIDGLHLPTGFELGDGGAYIAQQPNLIFARDLDGDDVADERRTILHGFGTEDSHHSISAFTWGPGGGLYFQEGTFHHSQVETPYGPVRLVDAGIFRYKPDTFRLEVFVSYGFANPWGHVFDRWGQNFVADASGGANYVGAAFSGNKIYPAKSKPMRDFTARVRPTSGCEIVSSRHFPDELQGNFLINNVIGFQGIKQHRIIEEGSGFTSEEVDPLIWSSDINFRPVDLEFGPDGALYIVDWFNPLIGHMQYSLRDKRRDHGHGRIWRIRHKDRPLLDPPAIAGQPVEALLELLKSYEDRTRYRVRIELRNHPDELVTAALESWIAKLDANDPEYPRYLLEALWVYQNISVYNTDLLQRVLESPEPRARAAAVRVLRHWRHYLDDPHVLLVPRVRDEHPRVRLEAIVALSYILDQRAAEIALLALHQPMDYYLDYALNETIDTLSPKWKPALAEGTLQGAQDPALAAYLVSRIPTNELRNFARSEAVYDALLRRHDVDAETRREAAQGLADTRGTRVPAELLHAMREADASDDDHAAHLIIALGQLLNEQEAAALQAQGDTLEILAAEGRHAATRQASLAALVTADNSIEPAWQMALAGRYLLPDLVSALSFVQDGALQDAWYPRLVPLLDEVPQEIAAVLQQAPVQFIRIELPGEQRTLTVAEVEALREGENIAQGARARQSSTAFGGIAERAVDGNPSGIFENGGQTHTEPENNPWLEIDLGQAQPIDSIRIWNRRENDTGARLEGFRLLLLDAGHMPVFEKADNPAPERSVEIDVEVDPIHALRLAAIDAIAGLDTHAAEVFPVIARLASEPELQAAAFRALNRLPQSAWPETPQTGLADQVINHLSALRTDELSSPAAQDAFALGRKIAATLAQQEGEALLARLEQRDVTTILIRPVPHQMIYDRTEFAVPAGGAVEIAFENIDIMPHNLVLTAPGAMAKVGQAGEAMAGTPDGEAKQYIPDLPEVMHHTRLLYPGENEVLTFIAPDQPGNYPYVCTFPGHWILMNGTMRVVEELDETMIAANTAAIDSAAGAGRPFVKLWTFEELQPELAAAMEERNLENGRAMFAAAGCNTCHVIEGQGRPWGPDMSVAAERYPSAEDMLLHIIDPSREIEEGYTSHTVETMDFETTTGFLVEEREEEVIIRANQNDPDEHTTIARDNVDRMSTSPTSIMPTGLLATLEKQDIFDLLAYILAGAKDAHH